MANVSVNGYYIDALLNAVRETARAYGYAVTTHGSMTRDIDIVAIPWTDQACTKEQIVSAVVSCLALHAGHCSGVLKTEHKPHGRTSYGLQCLYGNDILYIDLSVMPSINNGALLASTER